MSERRPNDDELLAGIGGRMYAIRKRKKMGLETLGQRAGLTGAAIAGYEKGERDFKVSRLVALASALNTSVGYLVGETQPPGGDQAIVQGIIDRLQLELARLTMEDVNLRQLMVVQHMGEVLERVGQEYQDVQQT